MGRKITCLFQKIKVQKQLSLIFFIAVFIPVIIIGNYLIYNSRTLLLDHYKNLAHADNNQVKAILHDLTSNIYDKSSQLVSNTELQNLLSTNFDDPKQAQLALSTFEGFSMPLTKDVYIHEIAIYTTNETLPDGKYIHPLTEELKQSDWYQKISTTVTPFWAGGTAIDDFNNERPALCFYSRVFLSNFGSYAICKITVDNNQFKNRLNNCTQETVIWLNDEEPFFNNMQSDIPKIQLPDNQSFKKYYIGKVELSDQNAIGCISSFYSSYSNDYFYIASLNTTGYSHINKITAIYSAILLIILLSTCIFVSLYSRYFGKRVATLRETMHNVSQGNYNHIIDRYEGQDEISEVFRDLDIMVQNILKKEASVYEAELKNKELINQQAQMRFEMLSSQINPHFLYNTLETIRMRSLKAGNREVANAVKLLGKSMRYALDNSITSVTSLAEELEQIDTYLTIQKLRFHDKINYTLRLPFQMDTSRYQIMPFLIQPLVENAVLHGLRDVEENGRLILHILEKNRILYIKVFDNGCGMTPDELAHVQENIYNHPKDSSKSIGLYNVYQRIQLRYGPDFQLNVQSKKNWGTLFIMTIPAIEYIKGEMTK